MQTIFHEIVNLLTQNQNFVLATVFKGTTP